ncbi:MAG TPA: undecaprenyl-phosphate glucose phosphotransferase [Chloroflexia bacterium]|nr:undecaprenyl-phosphate glucose phosphotransferase [Chloroflexia bacterium]
MDDAQAHTTEPSNDAAPDNERNGSNGANGVRRVTGSVSAPGPSPVTRTLTAEQAQQAATAAREARATRVLPASRRRPEIPPLPPATHPPTKVAPVMLVLLEMLVDVLAIAGAFSFAYWLRFESDIFRRYAEPDVATYITMLAVTVATVVVTFYFSRLYNLKRGASRVDEFYKIAAAVSMGTVLSLATNSLILGDNFVYSRQILLMGWLFAIIFVTLGRVIYGVIVGELRKRGVDRARVLVVGTGPTAYLVTMRLDRHRTLGYKVLGMVDNTYDEEGTAASIGHVPVLGNLSNLAELVRREKVDEVIIALQGASDADMRDILDIIQDETVSVKIYPDAFQLMTQNEVTVGELGGLPLLSVKDVALRGWNRRVKRAFDIVFSAAVLVLTAPLFLLISALVKISSPGPVFFIQERVGLDGKPFKLVKFRTMRIDGDPALIPKMRDDLPGWTVPNDPRRTRIGTFLRRFSLDELPQFYNVLIGEMSVVGPRPEQPEYVQEFAQRIYSYMRRHREKAGITGWAQVNGLRGDSSIEYRTAADLYYVENWSVLFDLKIIVRTIVAMFFGKNAY